MFLCEITIKGDSVALLRGKPRQSISENITNNWVIGDPEFNFIYVVL